MLGMSGLDCTHFHLVLFDIALYAIIAKKEPHNFWLLFMSVEHDASVYRGCCRFVALNNLSLILLLSNSMLG